MKSNPDAAAETLSNKIKEAARQLGFDLVGISPVRLPPHGESFASWLRDGFAGELGYMSRTEALRRDPREQRNLLAEEPARAEALRRELASLGETLRAEFPSNGIAAAIRRGALHAVAISATNSAPSRLPLSSRPRISVPLTARPGTIGVAAARSWRAKLKSAAGVWVASSKR